MHRFTAIVLSAALAITLGARGTNAEVWSKLSIKADFSVSSYPSDESLKTAYYPATGGDPVDCRADAQMMYHFDRKFGRSGHGALSYRAYPNVEFELGFGYTSMQMEITQHGKALLTGSCWTPDPSSTLYDYDTQKGADVSYVSVRPGVNLTLSKKSRIVPYLNIGLDIMRISAKANLLDFVVLTLTPQGSQYILSDSTEEVELEGSDWAFGLDIGSGLEFKAAEAFSIMVGFSYMFQFNKAFPDFNELLTANSSATARSVQYYNEGMSLRNIGAVIGVKVYL